MRLNLKSFLFALIAFVVFTGVVLYYFFSDFLFPHNLVQSWDHRQNIHDDHDSKIIANGLHSISAPLQNIECWINQEYSIPCKHSTENHEVYVPFSFLRSYFDINGAMVSVTSSSIIDNNNGGNSVVSRFAWSHSNAKINVPKGKYDTRGRFAYFENYNVEVNLMNKCIIFNCIVFIYNIFIGARSCQMHKCSRRCANKHAVGKKWILLSHSNRTVCFGAL